MGVDTTMACQTKVMLISLAEIALRAGEKKTYKAIVKMANAEGIVLKSFDEAKAELDEED